MVACGKSRLTLGTGGRTDNAIGATPIAAIVAELGNCRRLESLNLSRTCATTTQHKHTYRPVPPCGCRQRLDSPRSKSPRATSLQAREAEDAQHEWYGRRCGFVCAAWRLTPSPRLFVHAACGGVVSASALPQSMPWVTMAWSSLPTSSRICRCCGSWTYLVRVCCGSLRGRGVGRHMVVCSTQTT